MCVFPICLFFILLFPVLGVCVHIEHDKPISVDIDHCMPISCREHGPKIQTPFRHKDHHPKSCGYPGFDVYCNDENEIVLLLPISIKVIARKIDYKTRKVQLYDPQNCLPQKLLYLNLSVSQFHFPEQSKLYNISLFNCSASTRDMSYLIPCLGDSSQLFAVPDIDLDKQDLTSCTQVNETSSFPLDIFDKNELQLIWHEQDFGRSGASEKQLGTGWGIVICVFFIMGIVFAVLYATDKENQNKIEKFLEDYKALKPTRFSYSDIRRVTRQFSEKLGQGGYGIVYKGRLPNEIPVAVKVLNNSMGNGEDFVNEVGTIGRIHHVNVVRLIGFCAEGCRRALVYEFLPNDSLEKYIFQAQGNSLGREKLRDIALGIAKGINYLHQGCDQRILHFDIKPHNILLDHNFNPKICDFGMAKLCSKEQSAVTMTAARGTMGYIAPEVLSRTFGRVSYKSDVYSFGMLLLEMVGGRKNVDDKVNTSQVYFPQWIYEHLNTGEYIWARIEEVEDGKIARKLAIVGLWCIQWHPNDRPCMKQVVQMLEVDEDNFAMPPNPFPDTNTANSIA